MKSADYHDYVIKDGRLVGEFEDMYRHSTEVPWHQDEFAREVFADIDIAVLRRFQQLYQIGSMLEIGCGLGHFTGRLAREVATGLEVTGMDVSPTAIAQAAARVPVARFVVHDVTGEDERYTRAFDLVMQKEVLWYVLDHVETVFANMARMSRRFVYLSQSFPETPDFLGCDLFPNAAALERFVAERCALRYSVVERDQRFGGRELIHILAEIT